MSKLYKLAKRWIPLLVGVVTLIDKVVDIAGKFLR